MLATLVASVFLFNLTDKPNPAWRLAFVHEDNIWVADGLGHGAKLLIKNADRPTWSPSRKELAFARDGNIWICSADGSHQRQITHLKATKRWTESDRWFWEALPISWHPTRPLLLFGLDGVYSIRTDRPDKVKAVPLEYYDDIGFPSFSRDGKSFAYQEDGDVMVARSGRGQDLGSPDLPGRWETWMVAPLGIFKPNEGADWWIVRARLLSWSPDGKYIAYGRRRIGGTGDTSLGLIDVRRRKYHKLRDNAMDPCFSPDGKWILCQLWSVYADAPLVALSVDGKRWVQLADSAQQGNW